MYQDLQRDSLLLITDTSILQKGDEIYGFEPVVKEIEYFEKMFQSIEWIGFEDKSLFKEKPHKLVNLDRVKITMMPKLGGRSLKSKLEIMGSYKNMYKVISNKIKSHQFIHVRAPSHPATIAMVYCMIHPKSHSKFWFKYAGSWVDKAPLFYVFQRYLLKKLPTSNIITINGNFEDSRRNFLNFQNPCISEEDRGFPLNSILTKREKFLFIGNLNPSKGVDILFNTFNQLNQTINFIGGSNKLNNYISISKEYPKIDFLGQQPKSIVNEHLKNSLALMLPSKSEGFPKVVSEAMNFGCIPIVSDVSCISEIIKHRENGYLLKKLDIESIIKGIEWIENLSEEESNIIRKFNFEKAQYFTYEYYIKRIENEIY